MDVALKFKNVFYVSYLQYNTAICNKFETEAERILKVITELCDITSRNIKGLYIYIFTTKINTNKIQMNKRFQ